MKKRNSAVFVLVWALLLALPAGFAMAQSDSEEAAESEQTAEGSEAVYTMEDIEELAKDKESPAVYTNKSLTEETAAPKPAPGESYSNNDLSERFGNEDAAQAEGQPAAGADADAESIEAAEPETAEPEEPAMSAEERAQLIDDVDGELVQLEKRLLAIKNPLLAGTAKPSADEAGLDNTERLRRTEDKIDELRKTLEELRDN